MDVLLKIQRLMREEGFSQREIARKSGITESSISRLFSSKSQNPTILAEAMGYEVVVDFRKKEK